MMASYISVTALGQIGRDAEYRTLASGDKVGKFSLAINQGKGDSKTTDWYNVTVWRSTAETMQRLGALRKGDTVLIVGRLTARLYTNKEGNAAISLDLDADRVILVSGSASNDSPRDSFSESSAGFEIPDGEGIPF